MIAISGIVKKNLGRGRKLGFPTANLDYEGDLAEGVYFGTVKIIPTNPPLSKREKQRELMALIFIGAPRTFADERKRLEAYILDFDQDLYGQEIEVQIQKKLRDNLKFESEAELIAQMKQDERMAREYLKML